MNMLDSLEEPHALSPLSTNVHGHDEDFSGLGDPSENDHQKNLCCEDDEEEEEENDDDQDTIVPSSIGGVDDDPIGLGVTAAHDSDELHNVEDLPEVVTEVAEDELVEDGSQQVSLEEVNVLTGNQLGTSAGDQEGSILLTTDVDGNLAVPVPVSADHVIRFLMQTSDGNMVTADAQVEAIKLSMSSLVSSSHGGEITQTVQAITLPDGTTTLIQTPKEENTQEATPAMPKFVEGQTIKLEDGSTALLQPTSREALNGGLQAVQLEDGSTAFITHPNAQGLFTDTSHIDASSLNLEQLANQTMIGVSEKPMEKALVIGDKAYKCMYEDCGRLYTTLHHLKVHERSHTGDRPFMCEFANCGKAFATGYGLKSHNRVHTGEKPYPCPEMDCEKAFKTSGDLQKHVRTHTGERPFKCPFEGCTRSFTTSNIRKVHIRTHTGERPYICDVEGCGRAFASATNYKNHIRIHTGEKPYACGVQGCGKRFTEYSSLYKHHVVHTHTKPYTCCHCGKTYRQTSTLAMHKRTAHGEDMPQESLPGSSDNALTINVGASDSGPPPAKKRAVKEEVEEEQVLGDNLTSSAQTSQMVLLTSQVGTSALTSAAGIGGDAVGDAGAQLASLVTLQAPGNISLQDLQNGGLAGITSLALGENGQQVLVVTDPAQLEALQHLTVQHLETLGPTSEGIASIQESTEGSGTSGLTAGTESQQEDVSLPQ